MVLCDGFIPLDAQLFKIDFLFLEDLFSMAFLGAELSHDAILELLQAFAW